MNNCTRHSEYLEYPQAKYCGLCGSKLERETSKNLIGATNDIYRTFIDFNRSQFGKAASLFGGLSLLLGAAVTFESAPRWSAYMAGGGITMLLGNLAIDHIRFDGSDEMPEGGYPE